VRERRLPAAAIISASSGDGRRVALNVRAAVAAHQKTEMQVSHYLSHRAKSAPEVDEKNVLGHFFHDFRGL